MIFTERTITVVNDSATINKPLILYRGDKNIELKITIAESQFKFRNTDASNVIETTDASYAQLVINTPYNSPIFSDVAVTKNGAVIFVITEAMIDEIREVGAYEIQIRLLDDNKQSRASIPPVSNAIEIREPIAIEDGSAVDSNAVNVAKVNRALTTTSAPLEAFDSQGNYIKKTWGDGDPITDAALNKMEAAIDGVNKKIGNNRSQIKDITNYYEDKIKKINSEKLALFYKKLKFDEGVTIVCQGDSLTYGHDVTSSDKRDAMSDKTLDTSVIRTETQAGKTYPERLQEIMNEVYGENKVNIINRGYSGEWVENSKKRWSENPNADLHLLMLGTNDALNDMTPYVGDIEKYIESYFELVKHIVLNFNSAVIILTPPKTRATDNLLLNNFRRGLYLFCQRMSIPLLDTNEGFEGTRYDVSSDGVHMNTKGYSYFAERCVAPILIGEGVLNKLDLYNGSTIQCGETQNVKLKNFELSAGGSRIYTPDQTSADAGLVWKASSTEKSTMYISFYTTADEMVLKPYMWLDPSAQENINIKYTLDFGGEQGLPMSGARSKSVFFTANEVQGDTISSRAELINPSIKDFSFDQKIQITPTTHWRFKAINSDIVITRRGWHTLKIETTPTSGGTDSIYIGGFVLEDYYKSVGFAEIELYPTQSTYAINSTSINIYDLCLACDVNLDLDKLYRMPAFKITLSEQSNGVIENYFSLTNLTENGISYKQENKREILFGSSSLERTLDSITWDNTTKQIKLNWGGNLSANTNIIISPA